MMPNDAQCWHAGDHRLHGGSRVLFDAVNHTNHDIIIII